VVIDNKRTHSYDLHREHPEPPGSSLIGLRFTTDEFDQQSEKVFRFCGEFGQELFK
jgi:hypothetical protein